MGKLSILLAFGFVLVSLQRCQGSIIDITTCHQVENCFQFFESATCNPDGTRQVCLTWTDFAGCEFYGYDRIKGICKMNNFSPTHHVYDGQQICDDAIGGTTYTFGIKSHRPDTIGDTNSGYIMVNGYTNNGGKANCQGFNSVCAAGGNNDFSLAFYVTPCATTTTTTTTTTPTTTVTVPTPPGCTCTDWGQWGGCSATCGPDATRSRYRTCSNCPATTPQSENVLCPSVPVYCPIDGAWTQWNPWAGCTASCGSGTNTRTRTCTNPPPQYNGLDCPGLPSETIACVLQQCSNGGGGGSGGSGGGGGGSGGGGGRRGCKKRAKRGRCSKLNGRARKQCIKRECGR